MRWQQPRRTLEDVAREHVGQPVHGAAVLNGRYLRGAGPEVLAVSDETVYLLDYHRSSLGPRVGSVVGHYPRDGLVIARCRRRWLRVELELSWPESHDYLAGWIWAGRDADRLVGLLRTSEFEREWQWR